MRILFISSHFPHARSIAGHQIVYQRMRRLIAQGHEVGLCAMRGKEEGRHRDPLYDELLECEAVPAPARPHRLRRLRDYALSRIPPPFWPYHVPAMYRVVGDMVERSGYDVVLAEFTHMAPYLYENPWLPAVRKVISVHQCSSMSARTPLYLPERTFRQAVGEHLLTRNLRHFEFDLYRACDRVLTLSRTDSFLLSANAPELRVAVVPPGIDLGYFSPADAAASAESLLFTGQYADEPNHDAFMWFVRQVWPLLRQRRPHLSFYVLGPNPTPEMYALARENPGVQLLGEIADIRPYLAKANVFVCPLRMGSGLRIKILEAMAAGLPVVATSTAAEGIPVQSGVNAMLADDPRLMADAVHLLLDDPALCRQIATHARKMVADRFNWDQSMRLLEATLNDVITPAA